MEQCAVFYEALTVDGGTVTSKVCENGRFRTRSQSSPARGAFDIIVQPLPDLHLACQQLQNTENTGVPKNPSVFDVLLFFQDGLFEWLAPFRWILAEFLTALASPLRIRQFKVAKSLEMSLLPVCAKSLIVVVAFHKAHHFDFRAYATYARSRGARTLALLHLGHENQWETEGPEGAVEDLYSWGILHANGSRTRTKRDLLHYFEEYKHFDFVLRQHFSPAYAQRSLYLPLGPGLGWLHGRGRAWRRASSRPLFCRAAFSRPLAYEYHWDRGVLTELLRSDPSLCNMTGTWVEALDEQLMSAAISLCPFGSSPETARVWESLLAGAVIVMTKASFASMGLQAPFVLLEDWSALGGVLARFKNNPGDLDKLQAAQCRWFNAYMAAVRRQLRSIGQRLGFPRVREAASYTTFTTFGAANSFLVQIAGEGDRFNSELSKSNSTGGLTKLILARS